MTGTMAVPELTRAELERTAAALSGIAVRTPLVESAELSRRLGVPVWVKCEQHQPIGAFKIRGAYTAISRLDPAERARGIVTHSSGNHGQAVAWVARHFGVRAVIVMPETAPAIKVAGIQRHGAEIVFTTRAEREARADELIRREGLVMVQPYDDPDVIRGQATCAFEILEEQPTVSTLLSPVGGGGMIAGTCACVRAIRDTATVYGVEPAASAKLTAALEQGRPVAMPAAETLADGLVPPSIGTLTFATMRPVIRGVAALTEDEIAAGVRFLFRSMGLRVEPSGATPVAALLAGRIVPTDPTALILTGGNVEPSVFDRLVG